MKIHLFCSKYDLYSKSKVRIDVEKVKPYYLSLIEKVCTHFLDSFPRLYISLQFFSLSHLVAMFAAVLPFQAKVVKFSLLMTGSSIHCRNMMLVKIYHIVSTTFIEEFFVTIDAWHVHIN